MTLQLSHPVLSICFIKNQQKEILLKVSMYNFKWNWVIPRSFWYQLNENMKIENFWNSLKISNSFYPYLEYPLTCWCRYVKHFDKPSHVLLCPISNIYIRPIFYYRNCLYSYSNNTGELLIFNRAALVILTPVDWCNVVLSDDVSINNVTFWRRNDVNFDDVTINNVTSLDEPTKGCVLETKWLLKRMRKLCVSLSFDPIFLRKQEVLGNKKWLCLARN